MNRTFLAVGGIAAAVALVIVAGAMVLGLNAERPGVGGQPSPTSSPRPSPAAVSATVAPTPTTAPSPTVAPTAPQPTPEPSTAGPSDFAAHPMGRLAEGDYVFTHLAGVRVVFTASSNWERNFPNWVVWSIDDDKATMGVATVDNVVVDPCRPDLGLQDPAVGPTVNDLVTAIRAVPGLTFSAPADVTQDGYSGVRLDHVPPAEFDNCLDDMGEAVLMSVDGAVPAEHGYIAPPNSADPYSLYIYDVDGARVVITAEYTERRTDELDEMLASIRFEQP